MAKKDILVEIDIPEGITVSVESKNYKITGPKGDVVKRFDHPNVGIKVDGSKITLETKMAIKKDKAVIYAYRAHINNAFVGVVEGHLYRMKICSGHFPMNVSYKDNVLTIKNFYGERVPRIVNLDKSVSVKVQGQDIVLEGTDREIVGQTAARIELATRRPKFDRRIFQDGIFITEKSGKKV